MEDWLVAQRNAGRNKRRTPCSHRPISHAPCNELLEKRILFAAIPAPFLEADIGSPAGGSSSFSAGTFNIVGAGSDFFGASDAGHFVYQSFTGDGTVTARVTAINANAGQSLAGLDIRSSLSPTAANLEIAARDDGSVFVNDRTTDGATGGSVNAGQAGTLPEYLRITRAGNAIQAFVSSDNSTYTLVGGDTVTLPGTVLVGFSVASQTAPTPNTTATFDQFSIVPASAVPPTAAVSSAPTAAGPQVAPYQFTVTYTGTSFPIDASTITGSNILITGPGGFSQPATLVSSGLSNGSTVNATYQVTGLTNLGTYQVNLLGNQVKDTANTFVASGNLGTFALVADTVAPTATVTAGSPITVGAAPTSQFTVTFSDNGAVKASTLGNNNLRVTGPGGYSQLATLVSTGLADGKTISATYRIPTPTTTGTYSVATIAGQVTDLSNNGIAGATVGTLSVTPPIGFIFGTVTGAGGVPLSGRHVFLDTNNDGVFEPGEAATATDVSGNYFFSGLIAGTYHVVQFPDFGETVQSPTGASQPATVTSGQVTSGINFVDAGAGSIFGSVRLVDGTALSGRQVFIDANNDGVFESTERTTTTDASGNYSFTNLAAATYHVVQVPGAGQQVVEPTRASRTAVVRTAAVTRSISFTDAAATVPNAPADLTGSFVGTLPASVLAGASGTAKLRITNAGAGRAKGNIRITLLASPDGTASDALATIKTFSESINLAAGGATTRTLTFKFPTGLAAGSYSLVAVIDSANTIPETNKLNNIVSSTPIQIAPPFVDLTGSFTKVPSAATTGRSLSVSILVTNAGNKRATGRISIGLFESPTQELDESPNLLNTFSNRSISIAPGGRQTLVLTLKLPPTTTTGSRFLIARLNSTNTVAESDTTNDTVVAATATTFS